MATVYITCKCGRRSVIDRKFIGKKRCNFCGALFLSSFITDTPSPSYKPSDSKAQSEKPYEQRKMPLYNSSNQKTSPSFLEKYKWILIGGAVMLIMLVVIITSKSNDGGSDKKIKESTSTKSEQKEEQRVSSKDIFLNKVNPLLKCLKKAYLKLQQFGSTVGIDAQAISEEVESTRRNINNTLTESERKSTSWSLLCEAAFKVNWAKVREKNIIFYVENGLYTKADEEHRSLKSDMKRVEEIIKTYFPEALELDFGK